LGVKLENRIVSPCYLNVGVFSGASGITEIGMNFNSYGKKNEKDSVI